MTIHRTLKIEKLARIYDDEIAPVWGARFGKMLLRNLAMPERSSVLDVSCGTGYPTIEILRRMSEGSRLIAIDASSAMLDVARRKVADLGPLGKKGIFFRTESPLPKLSFADDVYDLVICNLGLSEMPNFETALRDFARVTKRTGEVRCTLPLAGTFQEFHDLYREVLIKHDKHDALERLEAHIARYPTIDDCERYLGAANLEGGMEVEEFSLLFKSSREFFFAPVIEYGPLADWKEIAGGGQEMQDVFWYIKEAIDAYFDGRPFQVTVKAGCLIGKKEITRPVSVSVSTGTGAGAIQMPAPLPEAFPDSFDELDDRADGDLPQPPELIAAGSVRVDHPDELDVVEELDPLELDDGIQIDDDDDGLAAEAELDAFIEGRKRPPHLDD